MKRPRLRTTHFINCSSIALQFKFSRVDAIQLLQPRLLAWPMPATLTDGQLLTSRLSVWTTSYYPYTLVDLVRALNRFLPFPIPSPLLLPRRTPHTLLPLLQHHSSCSGLRGRIVDVWTQSEADYPGITGGQRSSSATLDSPVLAGRFNHCLQFPLPPAAHACKRHCCTVVPQSWLVGPHRPTGRHIEQSRPGYRE